MYLHAPGWVNACELMQIVPWRSIPKQLLKVINFHLQVGRNPSNRRTGFSDREWPISGGEWSPASCSYSEIVITGHQDGSIKFWDASAGTLQVSLSRV